MSRTNRIASALAGLVLTASLAACGDPATTADSTAVTAEPATTSSTGTRTEAPTVHNDADTTFAQMMIIHHEGAVEMSELAIERAEAPEVVALAERISAAQGPEINQMHAWLTAWDEEASPMDHGGMDHGGMDMGGMSQEEMMSQLESLSGTEFDATFLEGMIAHHEGAVVMAEAQLADGQNAEALTLAEKIISDQKAEITEMEDLLAGL